MAEESKNSAVPSGKIIFSTELAWVFGIILVAFGTVFMEKSDYGVSMVVAPAYLIYRALSPALSFMTFGKAEYCLQAVLLVIMCLVLRRVRASWLFSFVTAVIYGIVLDILMALAGGLPTGGYALRTVWFVLGLVVCAAGVAMMFRTYIAPEVYELFVKEVSAAFHVEIHKFKTGYDCTSCVVAVLMSFAFFGVGHFVGVKLGTVVCALLNGFVISRFSAVYERFFEFRDMLPWRKYFTGEEN